MQDMIRRIVEADNEAKALEEKNREATEKEKLRIEEEAAATYREYMDNAQEEHLQRSYSRKLSDTTAKQESVLIKLKADYEKNCDKWVDEIVDRVIKER